MSLDHSDIYEIAEATHFIHHIPQPIRKKQDTKLVSFSAILPNDKTKILEAALEDRNRGSRAVGCFIGQALGDSVTTPWDLMPLQDALENNPIPPPNPINYYQLKEGQFNDNTSMALALSESLLVRGSFDPIDTRRRWYHWWYSGYCSVQGSSQISVGLNGNIKKGLQSFSQKNNHPFVGKNKDAGSHFLVGVAPITIYYRDQPEQAIQMAQYQSYVTQGSEIAAVCAATLSFILIRLMHQKNSCTDASTGELRKMLEDILDEWSSICHLQLVLHPQTQDPRGLVEAIDIIQQISTSKPKKPKPSCQLELEIKFP